jgi:hypothetical protein
MDPERFALFFRETPSGWSTAAIWRSALNFRLFRLVVPLALRPSNPFPRRLSPGSVRGDHFVPHLLLSTLPLWGSPHATAAEMNRVSWGGGAGKEGALLGYSILTSALNSADGIAEHCSVTAFFRHKAHPLADSLGDIVTHHCL